MSLFAVLVVATAASSYVPSSERIGQAVSDRNRKDGRVNALLLNMALQLGENKEIVARGVLEAELNGRVKFELEGARGVKESHIRINDSVESYRQGQKLKNPRPFLAPFSLLQADSSSSLQTKLQSLGGSPDVVELGYSGDHDCYVLGGRDGPVSLWIDLDSFEVVRIQLADGVVYHFGPTAQFQDVVFSSWIDILGPDGFRARLLVEGAEALK